MALNLLTTIAAALGGGLVVKAYSDAKLRRLEEDRARQHVLDQASTTLDQGSTYAVAFMLDPTSPQWGGVKDLPMAVQMVKASFEAPGGTGGWRLVGVPAPASAAQRDLFLAGKPSQWNFVGVWTRPEKFMVAKPDWVTMAVPFKAPAAPQ